MHSAQVFLFNFVEFISRLTRSRNLGSLESYESILAQQLRHTYLHRQQHTLLSCRLFGFLLVLLSNNMSEDVVLFIARQRRVGRASASHGYAGPKSIILPPRVPQRIKSYACTYPSTNITISQLQLTTI